MVISSNPILIYYNIVFVVSVILLILLILRWQVQLDVDMTVLFTLVPILNISYIKLASATNVDIALFAQQIIYLGGCFLQLLMFLTVCTLCHVRFHRLVRVFLFTFAILLYFAVITTQYTHLFYKDYHLEEQYGVSVLVKDYGPLHSVFYFSLVLYVALSLFMLVYCYFRKKDVSTKNLSVLALTMLFSTLVFFGGRLVTKAVEVAPLSYVVAEVGFLFISYRIRLYNISGNIANSVLENGSDGLICFDMKKRLLVYNNTALKMIPSLGNIKVDHVLDDDDPVLHRINMCIETKQSGKTDKDINITIGENIYKARPEYLKDHKGASGYYIVLTDVTSEHKYIEYVNKYNKELREASKKAEAADAAKTQFLAQMSHEIRTPINAILGMNEMISQESQDEAILDYAAGIRSSGHNLLFLINSILDFSKIEDGKMEIIVEEYDIVALVMNLVNSVTSGAEAKNLKFEVEVDPEIPLRLIGDDVRLSQVILNILSNAVKYTNEGRINLKMNKSEAQTPDGFMLHVEVRDTGIGIREADMDRLFDEFTRFDEVKNHRVEGTGLGMAIIYKLLKLMDSEIHVDSVYGEGSCFWFDIKQDVADSTPVGDYKERVRIANARKKNEITLYAPDAKVLVVDDNALNLKVTRGYLKICGITPDEAMSGPEAIELVRNGEYDVILLDHMMPQMDGIETLKILRDEKLITDKTTVVALTANAIEGSRELYMEAGFNDYISKPVELTTLASKLEIYLNVRD